MKNLINYYIAILIPIPFLVWTLLNGQNLLFLFLILSYYVYRCLIDAFRLISIQVIEKKDFWKIFIPLWKIKYFKSLYFKN